MAFARDIRSTSPILAFCNQFSLKKSSSFEQNVYGMEGGTNLSRAWKLRLHQLFLHWAVNGEPETFPLANLCDLELPPDLATSLRSLSGPAKKRLDTILALRPAGKKKKKTKKKFWGDLSPVRVMRGCMAQSVDQPAVARIALGRCLHTRQKHPSGTAVGGFRLINA